MFTKSYSAIQKKTNTELSKGWNFRVLQLYAIITPSLRLQRLLVVQTSYYAHLKTLQPAGRIQDQLKISTFHPNIFIIGQHAENCHKV